jgi:hypothetical protein
MRALVIFVLSVSTFGVSPSWAQPQPKEAKEALKETAAATLTRARLLKVPVSGIFTDARLGDVLKEFAAQVEMRADVPVLWTYAAGFPYAQKVTYNCENKPLEEALDELFTKLGKPGYVVVSKDGDKYDGWVRLTIGGERGYEPGAGPKATEEEEKAANERLALAKKLIADGKTEQARTVLMLVTRKYPHATAATEARQLLAKIEK